MTDIEQTPGDRLRLEIILKSLAEGGNNLAILSEHDLVLDFYANLLDERLRALGDCDVEFCFSTNSERLVQKFNEILGELTVDQALAREDRQAKRRYLVFRDSILMQDFELQLLARLVNGFPASNICVILLINSAGSNRNKLDAFGKTLLQWEVETRAGQARKPLGDDWVAPPPPLEETPPPEVAPSVPAQEALEVAKTLTAPSKPSWRIPGFGRKEKTPQPEVTATDAQPLPEPPAMTPAMTPAMASMPSAATVLAGERRQDTAPSSPSSSSTDPDLWLTREPEASAEPRSDADTAVTFERPKRKFPWAILWLVPIVTAGVFAVMYNDLIEQEVESFRKYLLRGTPAPATQPAPAAEKTPEPADEVAAEKEEAKPPATDTSEAEPPKVEELPSTKVAAVQAGAAATPTAIPVATPASPPAPAVATPEPVKPKEVAAEPKVKPKSDEAWIEQLTSGSHVVQLAAFDSEEEMQAFKRSDPIYAKARVLKVHKKDSAKRYFVLVAGPFASKEEAQAFMQTNPLLSKGWLRSAKSLKAQL